MKKIAYVLVAAILGVAASSPANGEPLCDEQEVHEMLEEGKTTAEIADDCEMSPDVIDYIRKKGRNAGTGGVPQLLKRGSPVGQCGCWGYLSADYRQPHPQCASGYAQPQACSAVCPTGGYMWRGVCS